MRGRNQGIMHALIPQVIRECFSELNILDKKANQCNLIVKDKYTYQKVK